MRKQSKLIIAAGIMALAASCNNTAPGSEGMDEAFIDSAVNARVDELRMEMMMQNDSTINVLAQERADSILSAMKNKRYVKRTPKRKVIKRDKSTMGTGSATKADAIKKVDDSKSKWGNNKKDGVDDSKSKWGNDKKSTTDDSKSKFGN